MLGELGTGVFQLVEDPPDADERAERDGRLIDLAVRTGCRSPSVPPSGGRSLELLDAAAAAGGRMFGLGHRAASDRCRRSAAACRSTRSPNGRRSARCRSTNSASALADPAVRERLVRSAHDGPYGRAIGAEARKPDFERMRVFDSPLPPNPTVADAARARGVDPVELILDLALETDLKQFFVQTFAPFDAEGVKAAMKHPRTVPTFSDAGAHVSQISDCSIHTHLLGHWVRDRGDFTLEEAVRMLTLAPARAWGFHDRGLLLEGMVADVNVFDPDTVAPAMPELVARPAGRRTPDRAARRGLPGDDRRRAGGPPRRGATPARCPAALLRGSAARQPAGSAMSELPWIISVDDHVVEPPTVWTDRLPARDRERGPHVVQDTCQTVNDPKTLRVSYTKGGEGPVIDWWVYEDLVKVVPKVVACAGFPVEEHTTDPIAYRDMRPGCYDPVRRLADMDLNRTERSLCFPYVTRFCGQMFLESKDKSLAAALRRPPTTTG